MDISSFWLGFAVGLGFTCTVIAVWLFIQVIPYCRQIEGRLKWYRSRVTLREPE